MKQEFFSLAHQSPIDELFIKFSSQRESRQRLRFTTREDRTSVGSWEVVYFGPNLPDIGWLSAVQACILIEQKISDGFLLSRTDVLAQHESFFTALLVLESRHERFFD